MKPAPRSLATALLALAASGAGAVAASAPAATPDDTRAAVRVCYNEQLGPADGGHFSLMLLRQTGDALPDLRLTLKALPWMRCLILASRGEVDAILGASHTPERARDLVYPRAADGEPDAARRLFMQGYRLLRRSGDALDTDGARFTGLTGLVGVERGHSAAAIALEAGGSTDENHADVNAMLAKLRSGRLGGALVAEPQYASLLAQPGALDGLEAVPTPLRQRAYYLVFSRDFARREPLLVERLWNEAVRQRDTAAIRRATAEQQGTDPAGALR